MQNGISPLFYHKILMEVYALKKFNKSAGLTLIARIKGFSNYPNLHGTVSFKQLAGGILVTAEVYGLPHDTKACSGNILGFHIHVGSSCENNGDDTGGHFNPKNCPHPYHAGDMPPLFENNGYAYLSFFTNRFSANDILGKVVVIHSEPDDFKSQPSGNSGDKIACGKITYLNGSIINVGVSNK